jgi:light-regulated signal transduction histidine kinase (bacteriophytochrome)
LANAENTALHNGKQSISYMPPRTVYAQIALMAYARNMSPRREGDASHDPKATDRGISEFLLRACHDLRNPLRSIRTQAELLLRANRTAETSESEERLAFIVDGAKRIELLAEGLVNYSMALEIEQGAFQHTRIDVLLRAVLARLDTEVRDTGAKVSYGELPRILGNPDRLMQVFENLLRNAIRYGGQEPPIIHITAEKQTGVWLFAVRDNGLGVEASYLESIFRPFERLNRAKSTGPGLGLTICRAIIERHGGRIWAESNAGAGSIFFFTLPAE